MKKRILIILGSALGVVVLSFTFLLFYFFLITPLDRPWILSGKKEIIEVAHVSWMCDCADFVETKNYHIGVGENKSDDFIFIEPARTELKLDPSFYDTIRFIKNLRLTGEFYIDKGIPSTFETNEMKPDHAKVFYYEKIEFVDKSKWNLELQSFTSYSPKIQTPPP